MAKDKTTPNGTEENAPETPKIEQGDMLTLSKAAEFAQISKAKMKAAIENTRFASIFRLGDTVRVTHFHPDVPDLIEINRNAIEAWQVAKDQKTVGARATRNGQARRYELRFTDDRLAEVNAALAPLGLSVAPAYKAKGKKAAEAPVAEQSGSEALGLSEVTPVVAEDLVSA